MINMGNIEQLIMNIIMFLFSKHRRLVFTAFNQSKYYDAINKLKSHGISYRSRITSHDTGTVGSGRNDNSQYDIYVKKDEVYLAEKAINS
jgi:precorrin-6B methylase 2